MEDEMLMNPRINEINGDIIGLKQLLSATDYKTLKYVDGELTEEEYEQVKVYRQQLRDKINALEAEGQTLADSMEVI